MDEARALFFEGALRRGGAAVLTGNLGFGKYIMERLRKMANSKVVNFDGRASTNIPVSWTSWDKPWI